MMSGPEADERAAPGAGAVEPGCDGVEQAENAAPTRTSPLHLTVISDRGERVEPPVRGERVLRAADGLFQRLDRAVSLALPRELNPFAQSGAVANVSLIVAIVSGIVLLVWYRTSVHLAYDSVRDMGSSPFLAGLVRSIHRYSSDATMLFVLIHATRLLAARRLGGVRWLAWVTGLFLIGVLWLVGWLGYWLVWDERGQLVALGSARLLDALPIFADPLSRSFLVDERLNSLMFFVVFFLHMLLPLAMGIALWLHITRLSRPDFLTRGWMTVWVLGSFVLVSLLFPADMAGPAKMALRPEHFAMDYWYLAPIVLTERLGSGALWAALSCSGAVLFSLPWVLARGRARTASVIVSRCNACEKCFLDCPYDAIQMVPRTDGRPFPTQAQVDPAKCVGCGICAGSCDSAGVGLSWFSTVEQRHRIDQLIERALADGKAPLLALVCNESAAAELEIDAETGLSSELPGYTVVRVPCAGWIHPLSVERALRRGARSVLIVASGPGDCMYREGARWTALRMSAKREPMLRLEKVDPAKVRVLELFRTERARLVREAAAFRAGAGTRPERARPGRRFAAGLGLALLLSGIMWGGTRLAHAASSNATPELVVSLKLAGKTADACRKPTEAELAKLPAHMRPKQICERRRSNVRMRVFVDAEPRIDASYEPHGIWHDGTSVAIERISLSPGPHRVRVEIGNSPNAGEYDYLAERELTLAPRRVSVVLFDKLDGFRWYE